MMIWNSPWLHYQDRRELVQRPTRYGFMAYGTKGVYNLTGKFYERMWARVGKIHRRVGKIGIEAGKGFCYE